MTHPVLATAFLPDLGPVFEGLLILALLGILLTLLYQSTRLFLRTSAEPNERGVGFPESPTLGVAFWLLGISAFLIVALYLVLSPPTWLTDLFPGLKAGSSAESTPMQALTVALLAAGVGASISTILSYLDHASRYKDFDAAFVPWYFARPLLGILLGLVFYLLFRGGLLATYPEIQGENLNVYGIAGLSALVGMFSKNAIEKLRELFNQLFRTESDIEKQILRKLPKDLRNDVEEVLGTSGGPGRGKKNGDSDSGDDTTEEPEKPNKP